MVDNRKFFKDDFRDESDAPLFDDTDVDITVTFMVSVHGIHENIDKVLMHGTLQDVGIGDASLSLTQVPEHRSLWSLTVTLPRGAAFTTHDDRRESNALFHVSYICCAGGKNVVEEPQKTREISSPLRRQYFHTISYPDQGCPGSDLEVEMSRRHASKAFFDYLLWDFERGNTRSLGDATPIRTTPMFVESVRNLQAEMKSRTLLVHFISIMKKHTLAEFQAGNAITDKKNFEFAHLSATARTFAICAVFSALRAGFGRDRNDFSHPMMDSEERVSEKDMKAVCDLIVAAAVSTTPNVAKMKEVLGPHLNLGLDGICFAAMHLYEVHGSYDWFDALPMLKEGGRNFINHGISTFSANAKRDLETNYHKLVQDKLSSPEKCKGWEVARETVRARGYGDRYDLATATDDAAGDNRSIETIKEHNLLVALIEFCPTVKALNTTLLATLATLKKRDEKGDADVPKFDHSHYVLTRVRASFILNHDFRPKECEDFKQLLQDHGTLLYGPMDDEGVKPEDAMLRASAYANTMGECVVHNNTVGRELGSMVTLLNAVLGTFVPNQKLLHEMRRWVRGRYANQPSTEQQENEIFQFPFVSARMLPALEALEALAELPCFSNVEVDHPLLTELHNYWVFRLPPSEVTLRAVLHIENEPKFPKSPQVLDRIVQTIARSVLGEVSGGETMSKFINIIIQREGTPASVLQCDLVFAILEHIGVKRASAQRAYSVPLREVLTNAPIMQAIYKWTNMWKSMPRTTTLHKFLDAVVKRLTNLGTQCANRTVTLGELDIIVSCKLCKDGILDFLWPTMTSTGISKYALDAIEKDFLQFQKELHEFSTYANMFCCESGIHADTLKKKVESLKDNYDVLHFKDVLGSFDNEPALPHVAWLFSLQLSTLFLDLWNKAVDDIKKKVTGTQSGSIDQETCVSQVIPLVQKMWVDLEASLRTGKCSYPDALKMFGHLGTRETTLDENGINKEVELLNNTTPSEFKDEWMPVFTKRIAELRKVERLTLFVPSILNLHAHLGTFTFTSTDPRKVDTLLTQFKDAEVLLDERELARWNLSTLIPKSRDIIHTLLDTATYQSQDFLIAFARKKKLIDFLIQDDILQINAFKMRIRLVRQTTDDQRLLNGLLHLSELRASVDTLLFNGAKYENVNAFLQKVRLIELGSGEQLKSVQTVIAGFDGLFDLLERNTGKGGSSEWKHVMRIASRGTYIAKGTYDEKQQLICEVSHDDSHGNEAAATPRRKEEYNFERLVEMRKLLLITDVAEDQRFDDKPVKPKVEEFKQKIRVLENIRQMVAMLHASGHFRYANMVAFEISADTHVDVFHEQLETLKKAYDAWDAVVRSLRANYYFFNYFFVSQLRIVRDDMIHFATTESNAWAQRWEGLTSHILGPKVDPAKLKKVESVLASLWKEFRHDQSHEGELRAIAEILEKAYSDVEPQQRECKLPQNMVKKDNDGDLIMSAEGQTGKDKRAGPRIFYYTNMEGAVKVMDVVLSIYFNRGRFPQPEELLICDDTTSLEEIELMLRRYMRAGEFHRKRNIFCIANVQQVPNTTQCAAAELLRSMFSKWDSYRETSAALVFICSSSNQVLLTSAITTCHAQGVNVPILPKSVLRMAMTDFCPNVSAIISEINGAGKTTEVLMAAYKMQNDLQKRTKALGPSRVYHRVSLRENSSSEDFLAQLCEAPAPAVVHIDIGHIVPRQVNSLLFHLLCVGTVMDPKTVKVFRQTAQSKFIVEVPNTLCSIMTEALSLMSFIPTTVLHMEYERIRFELPILDDRRIVQVHDNLAMTNAARWLRAVSQERFKNMHKAPKTKYSSRTWDQDVLLKEPITKREVWDILMTHSCDIESDQPPSFLLFHNFCRFMNEQFTRVMNYPLLAPHMVHTVGIPDLRHHFCAMLVATSRDFSLRQVPKKEALIEPIWKEATRDLPHQPSRGPSHREHNSAQLGPGASPRRTLSGKKSLRTDENDSPKILTDAVGCSLTTDLEQDVDGATHGAAENYIQRFNKMSSWEEADHPVALFKYDHTRKGEIGGIDLVALNKDKYLDDEQPTLFAKYLPERLLKSLDDNLIYAQKSWRDVTTKEAIDLIRFCKGLAPPSDGHQLMQQITLGRTKYVVTIDNLLKILSIMLRLEYGLPVIMMGETGCGKTALVQFIAEALEFPMKVLNIHGGITDAEIIDFVHECIEDAAGLTSNRYLLAFLDEINAGNVLGVCKTIVVDRMLDGRPIPNNVRIVACCNPYRRRLNVEEEAVALQYQHSSLHGSALDVASVQASKDLVYRVHPLPESLIDLVSDFGALSTETEMLYIRGILARELTDVLRKPVGKNSWFDEFLNMLMKFTGESHEFTRNANSKERSVVSLRDVARATLVFQWFFDKFPKTDEEKKDDEEKREDTKDEDETVEEKKAEEKNMKLLSEYCIATILTLGYCYYSRLNQDNRKAYLQQISNVWNESVERKELPKLNVGEWKATFSSANTLGRKLKECEMRLVQPMDLGTGIALNEALRENLFMLLVSVMNKIPIFVVGKPGCSKSLAVEILQRNLNGTASEIAFFKQMPALHVMAYQCSPLSTARGIENQFDSARKFKGASDDASNTIVCVLLDEVGLAEESPHMPLKVLHKELEAKDDGMACIGISNWNLDAAKMSRAVTLFRPMPTEDDLIQTARGMVSFQPTHQRLRALSAAFHKVYVNQKRKDFWGLREFYSIVRVIDNDLRKATLTEGTALMNAVLRNFGGRPQGELEDTISCFFKRFGVSQDTVARPSICNLITQNLRDPDARHLMLLTQNNSALRLLFDLDMVTWGSTHVMFGSSFEEDQTDMMVATQLNRIKQIMRKPERLILVQCDALYESLYDLLNQHYVEYAKTRYVRIAHGGSSTDCEVHELFRIIVITDKLEAWNALAPPLLNRFEKQIFVRGATLNDKTKLHKEVLEILKQYFVALVEDFSECITATASHIDENSPLEPNEETDFSGKARRVIVGYHTDLLPSLVLSLRVHGESKRDELVGKALRKLIWVMAPECVTAVAAKKEGARIKKYSGKNNPTWPDLSLEYFQTQKHENLCQFVEYAHVTEDLWTDSYGGQFIVMTHTPIGVDLVETLREMPCSTPTKSQCNRFKIRQTILHEHKSGSALEHEIKEFYASEEENLFIIQANVWASPTRQLEFCRYACERKRYEWVNGGGKDRMVKLLVMVIHLVRNVEGKTINFEFDKQWCTVYIDAVCGASISGLPSLDKMLNMKLKEVMENVDMHKVLPAHVLRPALAQLVYPMKRTSADLSKQIKMLLEFLADPGFINLIRQSILPQIFEQFEKNLKTQKEMEMGKAEDGDATYSSNKFEWHVIAQTPERMQRAGTFRAALHSRLLEILQALISRLLAWFDRNNQLYLFKGETQAVWRDMAVYSLRFKIKESLISCLSMKNPHIPVEVENNSLSDPFTAKFPFSFIIAKLVTDALHTKVDEHVNLEAANAIVEKQKIGWKFFRMPIKADFESNGISYTAYLEDFVAMNLKKSAISREQQAKILDVLCHMSLGVKQQAPLESVFDIHVGFWINKRRIYSVNDLLAAVPEAFDGIMQQMDEHEASKTDENKDSEQRQPNVALDVAFVNTILQSLLNRITKMKDITLSVDDLKWRYEAWSSAAKAILPTCKALLQQIDKSDMQTQEKIKLDLDHLQLTCFPLVKLMGQFIRDVALPQALQAKTLFKFINNLETAVQTVSMRKKLEEAFGELIQNEREKEQKEQLKFALGRFMEWFVLQVCVPDKKAVDSLTPDFLESLMEMCKRTIPSAGSKPSCRKEAVNYVSSFNFNDVEVPKTQSFLLALLRKLLQRKDDPTKLKLNKLLERMLQAEKAAYKHGDVPLMRLLILSFEGLIRSRKLEVTQNNEAFETDLIAEAKSVNLGKIYTVNAELEMHEKAHKLAIIRTVLGHYAEYIRAQHQAGDLAGTIPKTHQGNRMAEEETAILVKHANKWLATKDGVPYRSMRLFVLKHLNNVGGHTELRHILTRGPLSTAAWVKQWREETKDNTSLLEFLGESVLPRWNPFVEIDSYKTACAAAVHKFSIGRGGNDDILEDFAERMKTDAHLLPGFALALTTEAGLQYAQPKVHQPLWLPRMRQWITTTTTLRMSREVYNLLLIFSGTTEKIAHNPHMSNFILSAANTTEETIFQYRFLAHVFAACVQAGDHSPMKCFATVLLCPDMLKDTFLVCMDEDLREMLQKALAAEDGGTSMDASRFYQCENGHPYFIGNCGKAYTRATCNVCGGVIGGGAHILEKGNTHMTREDKSPEGYTFPSVSEQPEQEMYDQRRGLPPASYRCLRTILHAVMLLGVAARSTRGSSEVKVYQPVFAKSHTKLRRSDGSKVSEGEWFAMHFRRDWMLLKNLLVRNVDEVSAVLHELLTALTDEIMPDGAPCQKFSTIMERNEFETFLEEKIFKTRLTKAGMTEKLEHLKSKWGNADNAFTQELAQDVGENTYLPQQHAQNEYHMWSFSRHLDVAVLTQQLHSTPYASTDYPVLTAFMRGYAKFESFRRLNDIVRFQQFVVNRYYGRLSKEEASRKTFADIRAECGNEEDRLVAAFESWKRAWDYGFSTWIKHFECLELPHDYRRMKMNENVRLTFLLPSTENEGICPLVLTQATVEGHNAFLGVVAEARGEKCVQRNSDVMDEKDVLDYTIEQLMDFCNENAVVISRDGSIDCDFLKLEHHLREYFSTKPEIVLESKLKKFQFLGNNVNTSTIQRKLAQHLLPDDVKAELLSVIKDTRVLSDLKDRVRTIASFLSTSLENALPSEAHDMTLSEYYANVLEEKGDLPRPLSQDKVKLCHINNLSAILDSVVRENFDAVLERYKERLPQDLEDAVVCFAKNIEKDQLKLLLPCFKAFITNQLTDHDAPASIASHSIIDWMQGMSLDSNGDELCLEDVPWFMNKFPNQLANKYAVNVYQCLKIFLVGEKKESTESRPKIMSDMVSEMDSEAAWGSAGPQPGSGTLRPNRNSTSSRNSDYDDDDARGLIRPESQKSQDSHVMSAAKKVARLQDKGSFTICSESDDHESSICCSPAGRNRRPRDHKNDVNLLASSESKTKKKSNFLKVISRKAKKLIGIREKTNPE